MSVMREAVYLAGFDIVTAHEPVTVPLESGLLVCGLDWLFAERQLVRALPARS